MIHLLGKCDGCGCIVEVSAEVAPECNAPQPRPSRYTLRSVSPHPCVLQRFEGGRPCRLFLTCGPACEAIVVKRIEAEKDAGQ